ncbi:MAG TPA: sugar phosphate isomerase/epimerase [Ktedonobacterales bacterium]
MRLSFSTGTLYFRSLDYNLRLARDLGFDGVELAIGPEALYFGVKPLQRAIERVGLPVFSVHPPFAALPGWPRWPSQRLPRLMALARELGAELGVTHTMIFRDPDSARNAHFSQAIRMGLEAGGGQVALTIENSQYNHRLRRMAYLDHLQRLVNYAQTRGCGVTFDTCHAGACHEDILRDYDLVRPLLRNVHFNDLVWRDGQPHTHIIPGEGALPLRQLLERLTRDEYAGLLTVELHPREVGLLGRAGAERALGRSLDFMRATIAQASAAQSIEQA